MNELRGQVPRPDEIIEHEADGCRDDSREQRVGDGVTEDTSRIFLPAEHCQRGDDGKKNGGNGDKLEQPRVDRRHKVHQIVKPCQAQCAQDGTHDKGAHPQEHLFPRGADRCFLFRVVLHTAKLLQFSLNRKAWRKKKLLPPCPSLIV